MSERNEELHRQKGTHPGEKYQFVANLFIDDPEYPRRFRDFDKIVGEAFDENGNPLPEHHSGWRLK